jgi:hypothetical protein
LEGSCPVHIVNLDGAQSGELQYALEKTTPVLASSSILGVLMTEFGSLIFSRGAAIWSAMIYRRLGLLEALSEEVPPVPKSLECWRRVSAVMKSFPSS